MGDSVATSDVLECLRQLLDEHHQHRRGVEAGLVAGPLVLAMSVDERERLQPLIVEALRAESGLMVDASAYAEVVPLVGAPTDVEDLTIAVQEALDQLNDLADAPDLRLSVATTEVTLFGATDFAAASQAQQAVRGLLLSLFVVDLRANELVGLVYAEDEIDAERARIVWPLLMRLPELLHRPPASTLVVVAGDGEVQFDRHCTGDPSLRWRVTDRGLSIRHTRARDLDAVEALGRVAGADASLVVLMLGAGASAGYLPMGNDVRDRALEHAMDTKIDRHNFGHVVTQYYAKLARATRLLPGESLAGPDAFADRLTLERVLREEQHEERQSFSFTLRWFKERHKEALDQLASDRAAGRLDGDPLIRLLALRRRLVLVTVNFDQIIEAKCAGDVKPFITPAELANLPSYLDRYAAATDMAVPLIKAHGDIDDPDTIVADIGTTSSGLGRPVHDALDGVRGRILEQPITPLWHVGYSMRDLDLEDYWSDPRLADKAVEKWVAPMLDPGVERFIKQKRVPRWALKSDPPNVDESIVTLTAADFFDLLGRVAMTHW